MKFNPNTFNNTLKSKVIIQKTYPKLPSHIIPLTWFHLHFFNYRSNFFNSTYNLISNRISELQLTYMDNMWENLLPLNHRKEKVSKLSPSIHKLKNLNLNKLKLTKLQLLTLILRPRNFYMTSYIPLRLPSKYLNNYYTFLNTRVGFNKRNYMQRFAHWCMFSIKTPILQSIPYTTKKKQKHLRRTKLRTLKKAQTNKKNTNYISTITSQTNPRTLTLFPRIKSMDKYITPMTDKALYKSKITYKRVKIRKGVRVLSKAKVLSTNTSFLINIPSFQKLYNLVGKYYNNHTLRFYKKVFWLKKYSPSNLTPNYDLFKLRLMNQRTLLNTTCIKPQLYTLNRLIPYSVIDLEPSLQITTKSIKSFIWRNNGFSIISQVLRKNIFPHKLKSQFKKKLFSFVYPGQSKKNVLIRRKKQVLTRLLSKSTRLISSLDKFSYRLFYQLFTVEQFMFKKKNILQKNINQSVLTYGDNLRNVYYTSDYNAKGIDVGDLYIHSEVRIPRVRFKPGYQRIWRQVRSALKVSLNVKFQYQHQLTKYLTKFYHLSSQYLLSYSESTLDKIVVYSQLLPDVSTTELFSSHGFIYVNGSVTTTVNTILIKNDFLQLVVSLWYYIITRWFLNWTNTRIRKFKRLVYRKNKPLQYRIMKNKKQQSYYTPNWIYQTRYDNTDVKPYLEVDFFTLSTFILTDTYIQYYHKIDDMPDLRNSTYILYNWKYIT